jgi:hypothetical protein
MDAASGILAGGVAGGFLLSGLLSTVAGLGWLGDDREDATLGAMGIYGLVGTAGIAMILLLVLPAWVLLARFHRRQWWVATLCGCVLAFAPGALLSALVLLKQDFADGVALLAMALVLGAIGGIAALLAWWTAYPHYRTAAPSRLGQVTWIAVLVVIAGLAIWAYSRGPVPAGP